MTLSIRAFALALVALATAAAAPAQPRDTGQTTVGPVTVTGRRPPADEDMIRSVITPFVDVHAARDRKSGLLLRAAPTGVCAVALGLPAAFDDFVVGRIDEVARQAGAAVEPAGKCKPNVEVLFASRPQAIVDTLVERTRGQILGFHFVGEAHALVRVTRPIQAWYITGTSGDSSSQDKRLDPDGTVGSDHAKVRVDQAYGGGLDTGTGSLVPPRNRSQFVNVLIVADAAKVSAALRDAQAKAQAPDHCRPPPSAGAG